MGRGVVTERVITSDDCVAEGAAWLAALEPRFAAILPDLSPLPLRLKDEGFAPLLHAIMGQQVSVASANSIWAKLVAADMTTPARVAETTQDTLRSLGLSRQKARYAHELATAGIDFAALRDLSSPEVIKTLTAVPGIGAWTAEVYAKFSLGRADVFASGDLALQEGARMIFGLETRPTDRQLRNMAAAWSPWRSVAARIIWAYYGSVKTREGIR